MYVGLEYKGYNALLSECVKMSARTKQRFWILYV